MSLKLMMLAVSSLLSVNLFAGGKVEYWAIPEAEIEEIINCGKAYSETLGQYVTLLSEKDLIVIGEGGQKFSLSNSEIYTEIPR